MGVAVAGEGVADADSLPLSSSSELEEQLELLVWLVGWVGVAWGGGRGRG